MGRKRPLCPAELAPRRVNVGPRSPARSCALALGLCLVLSACQTSLIPGQSVAERGAQARGWVQSPDALLLLEAYDHCSREWREVSRALVEPDSASLGPHVGHAWRASLLPASFEKRDCIVRQEPGEARFFSLRVQARQGERRRSIPSLGARAPGCLMNGPWESQSVAQALAGCETVDELKLQLESGCPRGEQALLQEVPLSKAGNLRRLQDPTLLDEAPLLYHFEDSLLVGAEPPVFGMDREYRNYLIFERPALPDQVRAKTQLQGAWISWFSNFERTLCAHREDIGCGYASENAYEDFALSWVDLQQHPDPRSFAYGLALKDPAPLDALFSAIEKAPLAAHLRIQAQDVDRWFELPLEKAALQALRSVEPGQSMMLAGRVRPRQKEGPQKRSLLFVDHLVGTSLTPELEPRLTLLYCAASSNIDRLSAE